MKKEKDYRPIYERHPNLPLYSAIFSMAMAMLSLAIVIICK